MLDDGDSTQRTGGDDQLIAAVRAGDTEAYAALYARHHEAARRLACHLASGRADAEDLVSEAFAKVLAAMQDGGGPDIAFRPYLLTTMRNVFYGRLRRGARLMPTGDMAELDPGVQMDDPAVAAEERSLVARAFARLPERHRAVLWHTEVEAEKPAKVAPMLGIGPNAVATLAYRAREKLRQHYLQEHIAAVPPGDECSGTLERLGAHVRDGLSSRDRRQVEAHLDACDRCAALHLELWDINAGLKGILAPAVLGSAAAAGYTASAGGAGPSGIMGQARRLARRRSLQLGAGAVGAVVAVAGLALVLSTGSTPDLGLPPAAAAPTSDVEEPSPAAPQTGPEPRPEPTPGGAATEPSGWRDKPDPEPSPAAATEPGVPDGAGEPPPGGVRPDEDAPPETLAPRPEPEPSGEEPPAGEPPPAGGQPEPDPDLDDGCINLTVLLELKICLGLLS